MSYREVISVYTRYDGRCGICGEPVPPDDLEVDHIVPLSLGGEDSPDNLQPAHQRCNQRKQNKLVECISPIIAPAYTEPRPPLPTPPPLVIEADDDHLTVPEAAAALGLSIAGIQARIARGQMRVYRPHSRAVLIRRDEVERWRGLGRQKPGPKPKRDDHPDSV